MSYDEISENGCRIRIQRQNPLVKIQNKDLHSKTLNTENEDYRFRHSEHWSQDFKIREFG